jgi:uncharacterized protein YcfJ
MNRFAPACLAPVFLALVGFAVATPAAAQATANTSTGYAQVLRVEPVYELRTVQAVDPACLPPGGSPPPAGLDCKPHAVAVRRIVAYDVEYSYKGDTYMSRLKQDPGSRLRVRVSVVPVDDRAPPSVAPSETR